MPAVPAPPSPAAALEPVLLYAALAVVGVALPLLLIRHPSLWYDEFFSVYFAAQGPDYLLHEGWELETNPPLYYLLLWLWTELFGRSEVAVRLPTLIAHLATLPMVFAIARKLDLGAASWRAVAFYALSASAADYAIMARAYALWVLLLALAMLALASGIRALETPGDDRRLLKAGIGFAAASVAALYAHDMTIVFAAAADAIFLAVWWWRSGRSWRDLAAWIGPQIAALAVAAPQLQVMAAQAYSHRIDWIPELSALNALAVAVDLFGGPAQPLMLLRTVTAALVLGLFLWGAVAAIRRRSPVVEAVALAAAGFALLCLVSVWRPVLLTRTALWVMVPVSIVAAAAFDRIPARLPRLAAFVAVAALLAADTGFALGMSRREPWRDIVAVVAANKHPDDVVVMMDATPFSAFLYYAPGAIGWDVRHWRSASGSGIGTLETRLRPMPASTPRELAALLRQGRAVWLVSRLPSEMALHDAFDAQALPGTAPSIRMQRGSIILSRLAQAAH